MAVVLVKELTDPSEINFGLEKEGRSKLPGCGDYVQPAQRNGKWLTGLDETAPEVVAKGKDEIARVKAEREELERLTGHDLSPLNHDFWENILIQVNRNTAFDESDPEARIKLAALRARRAVAPNPNVPKAEYPGVKYYLTKPEEESTHRLQPKKDKAVAMGKVVELMKDTNKARLVAKSLGFSVNEETLIDTIYDMFISFIDRFPKENTVKEFNEYNEKDISALQITLAFEDAVKKKIIVSDKGTYRRGTVALGRTKKEALNKLSSIEFVGELESIFEELNEKR